MANAATAFRNSTTITAREAEVPNAAFDDGMNNGASNAPGLGVATDQTNLEESLPSWTLVDQFEVARVPQVSQLLGGTGLGAGVEGNGSGDAQFIVGVGNPSNDGTVTVLGTANLQLLATGWALL